MDRDSVSVQISSGVDDTSALNAMHAIKISAREYLLRIYIYARKKAVTLHRDSFSLWPKLMNIFIWMHVFVRFYYAYLVTIEKAERVCYI